MITKHENNIIKYTQNWQTNTGGFSLVEANSYSYKTHYYIIEELVKALPLEEILKHKLNKLDPKNKVYFTKSSTIPRYKLKDYLEQNKIEINKTNRIAFADTYVVGLNTYKTFIYNKPDSSSKYFVVPVNDLVPYADRGFKTKASSRNLETVLIPYYLKDNNHSFVGLSNYPTVHIAYVSNEWGAAKVKDILESFVYIANKPTIPKLVFDETLLEDCNSGIVIDEDIYDNLRGMLSGKNTDNISMAMEIMSNSEYETSKVYLLMLLNEFGNTSLKRVAKTTNYQSLLNYFIEYRDTMGNTWERFSDHMLSKVCKTDIDIELIRKYILDRFNNFLRNSKTKFKLEDIKIN